MSDSSGSASTASSPSAVACLHVAAGEGEVYSSLGDLYTFKATCAQTAGAFTLVEACIPPGMGPPLHVHSREAEAFYVLEGTISFVIDGRRIEADAGTYVQAPVGSKHSFQNRTQAPARMLFWAFPGHFEHFLKAIGTRITQRPALALPPSPETIERLQAACIMHGVTMLAQSHEEPPA